MTLLVVFMNILGFISTCEKGERNGSSLIKKASSFEDAFFNIKKKLFLENGF
jgi:hypothetical protein